MSSCEKKKPKLQCLPERRLSKNDQRFSIDFLRFVKCGPMER